MRHAAAGPAQRFCRPCSNDRALPQQSSTTASSTDAWPARNRPGVTEHLVIMGCVSRRLIALLLVAGALAAAATGASEPSQPAVVSASAYGISITVPGQPFSVAAESVAPGTTTTGVADGFVFPADGSLVRTGALSSSVSSRATGAAGAQGVSDVLEITLFNGEVTAESVAARAKATETGADAEGSRVVNLVVLGTPVAATPNLRVALADWGYLVALE